MAELGPGAGAWLDPLWQAVEAAWADSARHEAILAQCQTPEKLAEAARRYRLALAHPERAPTAKRQLDAITALAFAQLTPRGAEPERRRIWPWVWLALLLAGVISLAREL